MVPFPELFTCDILLPKACLIFQSRLRGANALEFYAPTMNHAMDSPEKSATIAYILRK